MNATSADGAVTLDAACCLGRCAIGPSMLVDGVPRAGMTSDRAAPIFDRLRA